MKTKWQCLTAHRSMTEISIYIFLGIFILCCSSSFGSTHSSIYRSVFLRTWTNTYSNIKHHTKTYKLHRFIDRINWKTILWIFLNLFSLAQLRLWHSLKLVYVYYYASLYAAYVYVIELRIEMDGNWSNQNEYEYFVWLHAIAISNLINTII